MSFTLSTALTATGLFLAMLLLQEGGWRWGRGRRAADPTTGIQGLGALEGAVFGLLGLLLAFTFSGAAARFEARRSLVTREANAIGTAYLRLDLLPAPAREPLKADLRSYLEARIAASQAGTQPGPVPGAALQGRIWAQAVAAARQEGPPTATLLLPALNEVFDLGTTRAMARHQHPPLVVFGMLGTLMLAGAFLAGHGMSEGRRSWPHVVGFAALFALTFFVILDLEYPRQGLIRVDGADQVLVSLRASLN